MASGEMSNENTRKLLQLLNGVNLSQFENTNEEENVEEVRRKYLLGRIITDILASDIQPQIKKHKLEELNGLNSNQLWQTVKWAKKVEYGASQSEYDAIPAQHRGELQVVSISEMNLVTNYFTEEVKETMSRILKPSATYNYSVHSPASASASAGGSGASTPQSAALKTRVLNVLIHYYPGDADNFRLMSLDVLHGHLGNVIENLTVRNPELETLYKNVKVYLKSKKSAKSTVVTLQSKLQYVLPRFANGNRQRFASMTLPELQTELRTLMTNTQNAAKKEEIRLALQEGKGSRVVPVRQVSKPGNRWTMTKGSPRKTKARKTRRSKHRK
jgi:hypothetical protein